MIKAGIDIGSRTIKLVVLDENDMLIHSAKCESGFNIIENCTRLLDGVTYDTIRATGYGRHLFCSHFGGEVVSEISAFATGVNYLFPECRTILDIGGQDTKAISIDAKGKIRKFEMNDKCAAGTGRFLEIMSMALNFSLNEFGDNAFAEGKAEKVNSMCTVFAESEVVSLLAKGVDRALLAKGIMQSVINRACAQLNKVGINGSLIFVGGVALNRGMVKLLSDTLGKELLTPDDPQIIGAIGAAMYLD
ncbi:MAG: acyl-CoA dehydratase activase [Marinifilaceae bacterium]